MTGYGRKDLDASGISLTVEIRSVNNRFIDIQVKTPRSLMSLEPRIKKIVQDRCARGRFDVFISRGGQRESTGRIAVDEQLLNQYVAVMTDIRERFGLGGDVNLSLISGFPGLVTVSEEREDLETLWTALSQGVVHALAELDAMRAEEGAALVADITRRLGTIEELLGAVETLSPLSVEQARKRMAEALARLVQEQMDPARLAQEVAILAERTDVTEELTRLRSHINQFRALIAAGTSEPVGRKLDFLLQEMGREANTIASKAMQARIAHHIVEIKAELEKIREQVQNIE
jgi:uncharacterized protein (TIGR00255 family)